MELPFLTDYPKNSSENEIVISINDESENLITTRVVHDNPSVENGYATLFAKFVGNASDALACTIQYYGGSSVGYTASKSLEDPDGTTSWNAATEGTIVMIHLNRQKHWGMHRGFKIGFTKTGTNALCTVTWGVIYR